MFIHKIFIKCLVLSRYCLELWKLDKEWISILWRGLCWGRKLKKDVISFSWEKASGFPHRKLHKLQHRISPPLRQEVRPSVIHVRCEGEWGLTGYVLGNQVPLSWKWFSIKGQLCCISCHHSHRGVGVGLPMKASWVKYHFSRVQNRQRLNLSWFKI